MIVSELRLYDFRRFHSENGEPGLSVSFHNGLNALIGENDSGKTAIIDALKLVLLTQSNDYVHPVEEDFYSEDGNTFVDEFRIDCVLTHFNRNEAKNFIEFLEFSRDDTGLNYTLRLFYRARRSNNRIFPELRINNPDEGMVLDSGARELLKAVYLRPLRDAEKEMHSGRNSRLSQILLSHKLFQDKENHILKDILQTGNLLFAVGEDVNLIALVHQSMELLADQVEVLVEERLRFCVEVDALFVGCASLFQF